MVLGSIFYAAHMITTKRLSATDSALAVLFWMSLIQLPLTLVAALPQWVAPQLATFVGAAVIFAGTYYSLSRETRRL